MLRCTTSTVPGTKVLSQGILGHSLGRLIGWLSIGPILGESKVDFVFVLVRK